MQRNPHPRTIEEFEKDDEMFGPASWSEELRMETELAWAHLSSAAAHIQDTHALLQRVRANAARARKLEESN